MTTYWKNSNPPTSEKSCPKDSSILIIGSGLAGTSTAYFLLKQNYTDVTIVDCGTENASYFRNAGHILHGAGENYKAMSAIHGRAKTKTMFSLAESFCKEIKNTIQELSLDCDYHQGDYVFVGHTEKEENEIKDSVALMNEDGFSSSYLETDLRKYGFKKGVARGCSLSAQANPDKFRNQLLKYTMDNGVAYHSFKVVNVEEVNGRVQVDYEDGSRSHHDALVIAANAYSPLFSKFFSDRKLIDPFKGQIIVSKPMKTPQARMQFSMDHGYMYGTVTTDNRFLIGGWRNHVPGKEMGTYDLNINSLVEEGLKTFTEDNFTFEELEWEYSWAGIMGSSQTGFPFIGPTNSSVIYACAGCTGYGFGWFHGSSKMLVDIIMGNQLPEGYHYFNPKGQS